MITTVSIALYLTAAFFAATTGVIAEQFKNGAAKKDQGRFAVAITVLSFLMAAILQVFS